MDLIINIIYIIKYYINLFIDICYIIFIKYVHEKFLFMYSDNGITYNKKINILIDKDISYSLIKNSFNLILSKGELYQIEFYNDTITLNSTGERINILIDSIIETIGYLG